MIVTQINLHKTYIYIYMHIDIRAVQNGPTTHPCSYRWRHYMPDSGLSVAYISTVCNCIYFAQVIFSGPSHTAQSGGTWVNYLESTWLLAGVCSLIAFVSRSWKQKQRRSQTEPSWKRLLWPCMQFGVVQGCVFVGARGEPSARERTR